MAFIIQQSSRVINVIDTNMPDPSEQIVDAFSLDSVARPFPQTAPTNDILRVYGANGDFLREFVLDGTLQTQDLNAAPVVWAGTLDELSNKINNEYFVNQSSGGTFPPDYSNSGLQTDLKNLATAKSKQFYFDLSDIEVNTLTFPVTCTLSAANSSGSIQSVPSATYNDLSELIAAFNTGITYYQLELRTVDSFYVLPGTVPIERDNLTDFLQFNTGLGTGIRQYKFYRLNIGSYPAANLSSSDSILDENIATNGTGRGEELVLVNPQNAIFYNVKSIQVLVKAANDNDIEIKELSRALLSTQPVTFPFNTAKGNPVETFSKTYARVSKNPIVINNTGAATNEVVVSVLY